MSSLALSLIRFDSACQVLEPGKHTKNNICWLICPHQYLTLLAKPRELIPLVSIQLSDNVPLVVCFMRHKGHCTNLLLPEEYCICREGDRPEDSKQLSITYLVTTFRITHVSVLMCNGYCYGSSTISSKHGNIFFMDMTLRCDMITLFECPESF